MRPSKPLPMRARRLHLARPLEARSRDSGSGRRTRLLPVFKLRETRGSKITDDGALRFVGSARVGCASGARVGGGFFEPSVNVNCYHACRFRGGLRVPLAVRRRASGRLPFSRPLRRDVQIRATDAIQIEFWLGASVGFARGRFT